MSSRLQLSMLKVVQKHFHSLSAQRPLRTWIKVKIATQTLDTLHLPLLNISLSFLEMRDYFKQALVGCVNFPFVSCKWVIH